MHPMTYEQAKALLEAAQPVDPLVQAVMARTDYLQIIPAPGDDAHVRVLAEHMRAVAQTLAVPVVLLAQEPRR